MTTDHRSMTSRLVAVAALVAVANGACRAAEEDAGPAPTPADAPAESEGYEPPATRPSDWAAPPVTLPDAPRP